VWIPSSNKILLLSKAQSARLSTYKIALNFFISLLSKDDECFAIL